MLDNPELRTSEVESLNIDQLQDDINQVVAHQATVKQREEELYDIAVAFPRYARNVLRITGLVIGGTALGALAATGDFTILPVALTVGSSAAFSLASGERARHNQIYKYPGRFNIAVAHTKLYQAKLSLAELDS